MPVGRQICMKRTGVVLRPVAGAAEYFPPQRGQVNPSCMSFNTVNHDLSIL